MSYSNTIYAQYIKITKYLHFINPFPMGPTNLKVVLGAYTNAVYSQQLFAVVIVKLLNTCRFQ